MKRFAIVVASVLCAMSPLPSHADVEGTFVPNIKPTLVVERLQGEIEIDGDAEDTGWQHAVRASNFTETSPGDQVRPPVATDVKVTYDETHLYILFVAHDDPAAVRASLRDRDHIFNDDYIGIILDTYGSATWAYELFVNPLGIQGDLRWTNEGEDLGFDVIFDSKGKVTEDGWQVEVSVPFKSLRFPNRESQEWRATFWRNHPRDSRRRYSWATVSRDDPCFPCQFGTIAGLEGIKSGRSLEFLPTVVGSQAGALADTDDPASGFDNASPEGEASLGIRYGITPSVGAEATLNPDFSQVESDAAQVDVNTTFALFYPEKRPFFQEGSDLYDSWWDVIYTRTINDPQVAGKVTGRTDKMSFVYLVARDQNTPIFLPFEEQSEFVGAGKSTSNIFRIKRTLVDDSFIGAVATDRRYDGGGSGTVLGLDGLYRFWQNYRLEAQAVYSITAEPDDPSLTEDLDVDTFARGRHTAAFDGETYDGEAFYVSLERDARHWSSDFDFWDSSPTFRADNGFVTRNNDRRVSWYNGYQFYPDNEYFDSIRPNVSAGRRWNRYGVRKSQWAEAWMNINMKKQTGVHFGVVHDEERFSGIYFDNMRRGWAEVSTNFIDRFRFGSWVNFGDYIARNENPPVVGTGTDGGVWATVKPLRRWVLEPELLYSRLEDKQSGEEFFSGWIVRTRSNLQFTRELFLRFIVQYNDFGGGLDLEPLLTYRLNPFTIFYIGSTHRLQDFGHHSIDPNDRSATGFHQTERQFFFKLQYFFRV